MKNYIDIVILLKLENVLYVKIMMVHYDFVKFIVNLYILFNLIILVKVLV